jgi:lysophospholipase L1-like esterase
MKIFLSILFIFIAGLTYGQTEETSQYHHLTVYGKAEDNGNSFHRIDTNRYPNIPGNVKRLLTNGAGLFVSFKSNSEYVKAKWCVTSRGVSPNMTEIAYKGLDLYIKNKEGKWQFAGSGSPAGKECNEYTLVDHMDSSEKEFLLYLPLYDEVKSLEIGVSNVAEFEELHNPFEKQILVYGSSIVQGASASRPGLAYSAQLSRNTGLNFVNLGLSGSARIEPAMANMIAPMQADLFILDFVPNSTADIVEERTESFIKKIRSEHPETPIIILQSLVRENGFWNQEIGERVRKQNEQIAIEFKKLQDQGIKNLYFIEGKDLLGDDHEGTIDGTHPTDIGFSRMLEKIQPVVVEVLKKHKII